MAAVFPRSALAVGSGCEPYVGALTLEGVQVRWDQGGKGSTAGNYDVCISIGYCDDLSLAETDMWIQLVCKLAPLTIFKSGVPGKGRPDEITKQVEDYWISQFELNGAIAVKAFGQDGGMPILFCSKDSFENSDPIRSLAKNSDFDWRTSFKTGAREVRTAAPSKRVGPDTTGQTRRIAASVVTFNPKPEQLERLRHLAELFPDVIVADNSEPQATPVEGVRWTPMDGNKGIAAALNAVCKRAKEMGYEWLFTLDQDTDVDPQALDTYLAAFKAYDDKDGTAIVAPRTDGRDLRNPEEGDVRELEMVMTSGCLTNLDIWERIGGFADELFIDEVDHDYCLNARMHGYRIVRLLNAYLPHQPGRLMTIVTLRGKPTLVGWHPPRRLYYIVRNYFFMKRRYRDVFPEVTAERRRLVIAKFREYLLYHPNRWPSVLAMLKGAYHGLFGRFGR